MNRLAIALLAAILPLASAAAAQNTPELPSAPAPVQPRFPGAPAQPPQKPAETAPAPVGTPGDAATLSTLPPADKPESASRPQGEASQTAPLPGTVPPQPETKSLEPRQPDTTAPEETGEFRIGVQVDLVDLIFTATDKHGHFIKDLRKDDVRLLDEGKPPQRVEAFESETGLPLRVGLLIDSSNSIRDRFRFEQDAAVEFLHQVVRPKSDQAFVVGFDSLSDLTQDYTDNTDALARGVRVLRPGGGTALHDAVLQASEKLASATIRGPARRAIILLSDGDDN
jgi:Ca-activated chloride channel homolog